MGKEVDNVLVGLATLSIRQPNDALAEWSREQAYAGSYSAKLHKGGSGNAGSTHLQALFPDSAIDVDAFVADPTDYGFWYYYSAVTGNFVQFELLFKDPNSEGWMELTVVPHQNTLGDGPTAGWAQKSLALTDKIGYGGRSETNEPFFDWDLGDTIAEGVTGPLGQAAAPVVGDWQLRRVRLELWEPTPERTAYVDSLEVDGTVYTVEPGGTVPGMSLSSPYTEVGYTEDGVIVEYSAEGTDVEVEEETFPIGWKLNKEGYKVTCNMAEASLFNMDKAMSGSVLSGSIIRLGGGVAKTVSLLITGLNPAGFTRSIMIPKAVAVGAVSTSYTLDGKQVVPVTFQALKPSADEDAVQVVDAGA